MLQRCSAFTINHQLYLSWVGWRPRTDAAECDSHFYVLFSLGKLSLEDFRRRVIDTVLYRGQLFGFSIYLFIFVHAGEDIARWGTTGPTDRRSLFGIGYGLLSTLRLETRAWLSGGAFERLLGLNRKRAITAGVHASGTLASRRCNYLLFYLVPSCLMDVVWILFIIFIILGRGIVWSQCACF